METLVLKNGTKKDLKLLIDIAKRIGLDLRVSSKENTSLKDRYDEIMQEAELLNESVEPNDITMDEIVEECRIVRQERYEREQKSNIWYKYLDFLFH